MLDMKALSFYQPRAEQVICGEKTVDVRTWQTTYRGPLAIHAAAIRRNERCRELGFDPDTLTYSALIGTVELVEIRALDAETYAALQAQHRLDQPFPGAPCYGWFFITPQRLPEPLPRAGRRRLFDVEISESANQRMDESATSIEHPVSSIEHPATSNQQPAFSIQHPASSFQPDPARPFVLYTLPDPSDGYRAALYQWVTVGQISQSAYAQAGKSALQALWSVEVGAQTLHAVTDHLLAALRANGYKATDLARAVGSEKPFYLDEPTGLRLALILLAVKPLTRQDRIEAIGQGIQAMSAEEAYYWFSKCTAGPDAVRAQKALRVLLAEE
ncbi:MAG TPA: ASCH domain-containing protein [Anaerolineae bacterium]|nr:ASCH domain-containing protein [Anaerolineae bacterium]HQH37451.1 ASCH domain-containing protein [Anaerolineae bacterium]